MTMEFVSLPFTAVLSRGSLTLGHVNNTTWLLNSEWNRSLIVSGATQGSFMIADLISLEIKRFGVTGLVKVDVLLEQRVDHAEQRVMSAYLENGQTTVGLFPFSYKFNRIPKIKGVIQIFDFVNCHISDVRPGFSRNGAPVPNKCIPFKQLSDDFIRLLDHPDELSDVTLKCGTFEIPSHKCVLSARSPVFASMFRNQMQEGSREPVEIVDIEPHVLQAMLKFMYSGRINGLTGETAEQLMLAADKYGLMLLKPICASKLKSVLCENNVFRILVLGNMLDRDLKEYAKDFIYRCDKVFDCGSDGRVEDVSGSAPGTGCGSSGIFCS